MQKRAHVYAAPEALSVRELEDFWMGWILDGEIRQLSKRTLEERKRVREKVLWFCRQRELERFGTTEIRAFLAYLSTGHESPGGRWGNPACTDPVKPRTVHAYFRVLRAFFRWTVEEGGVAESPLERLRPPVVRQDQVQPFTREQVAALLAAARKSAYPRRDEAMVLLLLDTGLRVSELVGLKVSDLDMTQRRFTVRGKGNKSRTLFFGATAARALWSYLREQPREPEQPLFVGDRGHKPGTPLTRSGVRQLIQRLGRTARIDGARCSPHTFRHTFAIEFLRSGGNIFTLKELLGHTSLTMVNRYVALAQADLEAQHRQHSPADRIGRTSKG